MALTIFSTIAYAASGQKSLPLSENLATSKVTNTYANSQVDTVIFTREAGLSGLAFAAHFKDSCSVTSVAVRRVVDGAFMAAVAADTLANFAAFVSIVDGAPTSTTFVNGKSVTATVTLAPQADQYLFIVTYAASANGFTTPTVVYEAIKTFSRR